MNNETMSPKEVLRLLGANATSSLDKPRFIRIALFNSPDSARYYNGLAAQLVGDDMYGGVILLKTLEDDMTFPELTKPNSFLTCAEWEWNGGEDLKGDVLEETQNLYKQFVSSLQAKYIDKTWPPVHLNQKIYRIHIQEDGTTEIIPTIVVKISEEITPYEDPTRIVKTLDEDDCFDESNFHSYYDFNFNKLIFVSEEKARSYFSQEQNLAMKI